MIKRMLRHWREMNLFEIIFLNLTVVSFGILLGNALSPVLTSSLFVFLIISIVGIAYFFSFFLIEVKPGVSRTVSKTAHKTPAKKKPAKRK